MDSASAQWVLGPTIGVDVTVDNLGDLVNAGPMFDVFLGYEVTDQILVGANGTLSLLPADGGGPDQPLHPAAAWELWFGGGVGAAIAARATGASTTNISVTLFAFFDVGDEFISIPLELKALIDL